MDYRESRLWKAAFSEYGADSYKKYCRVIQVAFQKFRERAAVIAETIASSYPHLTDHSITHIDALWEMASLILPADESINPVEAFVLGGAFLVHDLGNGLGAYPGREGELRSKVPKLWQDVVATHYREQFNRVPSPVEMEDPVEAVRQIALETCLRENHAKRALELPSTVEFSDGARKPYFLIEDDELREDLGHSIGLVAASHWWPIESLRKSLDKTIGAPAGYPAEWSCDLLKLACLMRTADASHLDRRRAPVFLRALRRPKGESLDHWEFQGRIQQPILEKNRLSYSTTRPFEADEFERWWLAHDALQLLDRELRDADALLLRSERRELAARGVAGTGSPHALSRHIEVTANWTPIDARLRVSNAARLVTSLGGQDLYGDDWTVPLRELIQNASDAVRARQLLDKGYSGRVVVQTGEDEEGRWLEVRDTGLGMSKRVLVNSLLDFGNSFWGSQLMRLEYPGLWSKGFQPAGRYGIGFFSLFMWGVRVRVASLKYDLARAETQLLEFKDGLPSRPVLRSANEDEQLREGGTCVRVWFKSDPAMKGSHLEALGSALKLAKVCQWLAPTLQVDLYVEGVQGPIIEAADWETISPRDLLQRVAVGSANGRLDEEPPVENAVENLRSIVDPSGQLLGRACILPPDRLDRNYQVAGEERRGLISVDGLRAMGLEGISGVLLGESQRAARDIARPLAPRSLLEDWATEQALLLHKTFKNQLQQMRCAAYVCALGGDTGPLAIARWGSQFLSFDDLASQDFIREVGNDVLVLDLHRLLYRAAALQTAALPPTYSNVLVVAATPQVARCFYEKDEVYSTSDSDYCPSAREGLERTLTGNVVRALSKAWGQGSDAVYATSLSAVGSSLRLPVCKVGGFEISEAVCQIRRTGLMP